MCTITYVVWPQKYTANLQTNIAVAGDKNINRVGYIYKYRIGWDIYTNLG